MRDRTLFDQLGEPALRAVITDFYQAVFADLMIGYLFVGKDRQRLIDREVEFTARLLGGRGPYQGRSMPAAHRGLGIMGGHFDRRMQLLREALDRHQVAAPIVDAWLSHAESLRSQITVDPRGACDGGPVTAPTAPTAPAAPTSDPAAPKSAVAPQPEFVRLGRRT